MANNVIVVVSGKDDLTPVLRKVSAELNKTAQSAENAGNKAKTGGVGFGKMSGGLTSLAGAAGLSVTAIGALGVKLNEMGMEQRSARNRLVQTVGSLDAYNKLIKEAQGVTRGMVSETKLASGAFVLMEMGLATNATEAAKLANAGNVLAQSFASQGGSVELFNRLLATGNKVLLDNFGISSQQVSILQEQKMATLGMSSEEAKLAAIREISIEKAERLGATMDEGQVSMAQAKASAADLGAALGNLVGPAFLSATTEATGWIKTLKEGADAWQNIIDVQIPAIEALEESVAKQGAAVALAAESPQKLSEAIADGLNDIDAFNRGLVEGSESFDDYQKAIDEVTQTFPALLAQYNGAQDAFDKITKQIFDENMELANNATAARLAGEAAFYLAEQQVATTRVVEDMTTAVYAQKQAFMQAQAASADFLLMQRTAAFGAEPVAPGSIMGATTNRFATNLNEQRGQAGVIRTGTGSKNDNAEREKSKLEDMSKAAEKAASSMQSAFETASNNLRSTIENVLAPTLQEVFQIPTDDSRIDEDARRLATVANEGFGSEFLAGLAQKFEGQSFFQPILDAMASGDSGALQGAATDILSTQVNKLWDINKVKERVKAQLQQDNLRQEIISEVQAELEAEGVGQPVELSPSVTLDFSGDVQVATEEAVQVMEDADWKEVGGTIMDGMIEGILGKKDAVENAIKTVAEDAETAAREALQSRSPSKVFADVGETITQGLSMGIDTGSYSFNKTVAKMLDLKSMAKGLFNNKNLNRLNKVFASTLGPAIQRAGGTVSGDFITNFIASRGNVPKEFVEKMFPGGTDAFARRVSVESKKLKDKITLDFLASGGGVGGFASLGNAAAERFQQESDALRTAINMAVRAGDETVMVGDGMMSIANAQERLNGLAEDYRDSQQDIFALQKAQQDLGFLQQQAGLLQQARDAGLDISRIFEGVRFGLDASLPDLITATSRVVQSMVGQMNSDLGQLGNFGSSSNSTTNQEFNLVVNTSGNTTSITNDFNTMRAMATGV